MLWFLRLFSAFCELEQAVHLSAINLSAANADAAEQRARIRELQAGYAVLEADKLHLQDRVDAATEDRRALWEALNRAMSQTTESYRGQINMLVQKAGGGVPYPESFHLSEHAVPQPQEGGPVGVRGRIAMSGLVTRQADEYLRKVTERTISK